MKKLLNDVMDVWGKLHNTMIVHLLQVVGEEQLRQTLYRPLWELGNKAAKRIPADAGTIGQTITRFEKNWHIKGKIIENGPNRFVREVRYCPWSYFHPFSCKVLGWYMKGFCQGMNNKCDYELNKLIPEGDAVCLWIVSCDPNGSSND